MKGETYTVVVKQTVERIMAIAVNATNKHEAADLAVETAKGANFNGPGAIHTNTDYDVQSVGTV